jgi:hypothetical protein
MPAPGMTTEVWIQYGIAFGSEAPTVAVAGGVGGDSISAFDASTYYRGIWSTPECWRRRRNCLYPMSRAFATAQVPCPPNATSGLGAGFWAGLATLF